MARNRGSTVEHVLYGPVTAVNTADWTVTFACGALFVYLVVHLGGVHPETTLAGLWILAAATVLHGIWVLFHSSERPVRLNWVPLLFLPLLGWQAWATFAVSPAEWRGRLELIHACQALLFFWLLAANVRLRVHLWGLLMALVLASVLVACVAFLQVFRDSGFFASAGPGAPDLTAASAFAGRATGTFADPSTLGAFCLVAAAGFLFVSLARRLHGILRVLCLYMTLMPVVTIVLGRPAWTLYCALPVALVCVVLGVQRIGRRILLLASFAALAAAVWLPVSFLLPETAAGFREALATDASVVRGAIWSEAVERTLDAPLAGHGSGSFALLASQSPRVAMAQPPAIPHSDLLLWTTQFGLAGVVLLVLPLGLIALHGFGICLREPFFRKDSETGLGRMPTPRFFASAGLAMCLAFAAVAVFWNPSKVPALYLLGAIAAVLVLKASKSHLLTLPANRLVRGGYAVLAVAAGVGLALAATPTLRAAAAEYSARGRLDRFLEVRNELADGEAVLDGIIREFEVAVEADPGNADAWLGLSAATRQRFYFDPGGFAEIGAEAAGHARRALELAPDYWECDAQLGLSLALEGRAAAAGASLAEAAERAPGNPAALYYQAAYLAGQPGGQALALNLTEAVLAIDPSNPLAQRLRRKLLIP